MQNDFYKELFDNSNDLIQSVSPQGDILYVNKTWLNKLGYKRSEIKDLNIFQIIHPTSINHCTNLFQKIMLQETSISIDEFKLLTKNGDSIILEGYASSKFENNKPLYTRGIFKDITDKVKTEKNLEILNLVTQNLNETNDLRQAYKIALDKVCELDYVDIGCIYIVDNITREAVLEDHRNLPDDYLKRASRISFPKGITWKTILSGNILNVKDIQKVKVLGKAGKKLGIRSFVGIPIKIDKKTIGVFWILSIKEHYFSKNEVTLLNSIGSQIAISIARSKSYDELIKKNRYDEIISSVVNSVHSSINLQEVFENTVDALINNIEIINHVGLHIVEEDLVIMKAHRGHPKWFVNIVKRLERPRGFTWKTILDGKLNYCPDVEKDNVIGPAGRKVGTKSYVSVPITINNKTIGCINVHSKFINPFGKDELILLQTVTNQIAVAINNAQKAEELKISKRSLSINLEQINKKQHYDEIISTVVKSVHSSIDLQQVFDNTVDALIKNIKIINHAALHIVEDDVAIMKAYRGHPKWFVNIVKRLERPRGFTWKTII